MTTVEILRAAREQFETGGLWQGSPETADEGNTCVANACQKVAGSNQSAQRLIARLLGHSGPRGFHQTIFDWNDTPGRTVEEVLALFDRAIAIAEAVEQEHAPVHLDAAIPERLPEVAA
jgi:hypothetical protein